MPTGVFFAFRRLILANPEFVNPTLTMHREKLA